MEKVPTLPCADCNNSGQVGVFAERECGHENLASWIVFFQGLGVDKTT